MQRLKLDAVVIAIDTWLGSSEHYLWEKFIPDLDFEFGYPRLYHKFAANICNESLQDYVVPAGTDQRFDSVSIRIPDAGVSGCGCEVPLPTTAVVQELFNAMRVKGKGGLDHSGVITLLEELAGVPEKS